MKRLVSILLVLVLALPLVSAAGAVEVRPSDQKFTLDGTAADCDAFNIDGYNYVMLRGLAALLNGTEKQFSVTWDQNAWTATVETGKPYEDDGSVVNGPAVILDENGLVTNAVKSSQTIQVDGKAVNGVTVYNIGGNNYFRLRDLQPWLGFGLRYDEGSRTVVITTQDVPAPVGAMTLSAAGDYDAIRSGLDSARISQNGGRGGGGMRAEEDMSIDMPVPAPTENAAATEAPAAAADGAKSDAAEPEYSGTNVQTEGVDEGDVVKTDGKYLYILRDGNLILASAAGKDTRVLSTTELRASNDNGDGWMSREPSELYIAGNTVAVLSSCYESGINSRGYWDYRQYTAVDLYDVSDPAHPKKTAGLGQDGYVMGSRLKDGTLYLVTNYDVIEYDEKDPGTYVPSLYRDGKADVLPAGCVWICPEVTSTRYVVVSSYDLKTGEVTDTQSVLGGGNTLYMSHNNIYVANSYYKETAGVPRTEGVYTVTEYRNEMVTDLIRFDLSDGLSVAASGRVPGNLESQFSMDEYQGHLRLATTSQHYGYTVYTDEKMGFTNYKWDEEEDQTNGLYILNGDLAVVGSVTSLAPGEQIYSVRFDGDIAYFCTFRTMDPLFAVDVSDPAAPKVLSALKISGFSEYLHPWAEGLLFGAGYEADETSGRRGTLKLVMFDTSDKADVTAKTVEVTDLNYSEALDNHHAFLISREKNLIAFPADDLYVIYGYDKARGFYPQAKLELDGWSWDTRGLYVDDMLYVVGEDTISVISLDGFQLVKTVEFSAD